MFDESGLAIGRSLTILLEIRPSRGKLNMPVLIRLFMYTAGIARK